MDLLKCDWEKLAGWINGCPQPWKMLFFLLFSSSLFSFFSSFSFYFFSCFRTEGSNTLTLMLSKP